MPPPPTKRPVSLFVNKTCPLHCLQIVKRNVIENLVPVVIAAKHLLERNHSPLLKDMLAYLKELMQVHIVYSLYYSVPMLQCYRPTLHYP